MAPEVVKNQINQNHMYVHGGDGCRYDHKVDIWALGIFLYYFIEGRGPFNGSDVYIKILRADVAFTNDQSRWKAG